jgi:hypothetical protein
VRDRATARHGCGHGRLGAQCNAVPVIPAIAATVVLPWPPSPTHRGAVLEKEEVVIDQGGRVPAFTPPTKPRTGNHGATAVGSRTAATGGLGDLTGGWRLRPWRPRRGGGQFSRGVRRQRAASKIRLAVGGFDHGAAAVGSHAAAAGSLGDPAGGERLRPRQPRLPPRQHDINGCRPGSGPHAP